MIVKVQYKYFFVEDDPDNTVSIMLDGIESRLHIINVDVDLVCINRNDRKKKKINNLKNNVSGKM
jgi:hypothetical protein